MRKLNPPAPSDLSIGPNDIVVTYALDRSWQHLIGKAGGLVVEESDDHCYAVQLAEELKIPALIGAVGAYDATTEGELVILDPRRGVMYPNPVFEDITRLR